MLFISYRIGIGIGIVLLNRVRVTLVRERYLFMSGSAPGHPVFFIFKHSSPLLHLEQLLRTRYMWSFPMFAATGRERRKAPTKPKGEKRKLPKSS